MRVVFATLYLLMLSLVGLGANGTYSYFVTLARSQVGEAASADASDILRVAGAFDQDKWPGVGGSGFKITNCSHSSVWVYFDVTGALRDVVKHIEPFRLDAGQTYEIPLVIADAGDMGMLQWRNQGKTFSGEIIARVLNNYASYHVGKVDISADRLYEKMACLQVKPGDEIGDIKGVQDIANLIDEKNRLINEVAQLKEEKRQLELTNISLQNEIDSLYKTIAALVNSKTTGPASEPAPAQQVSAQASAPAPAASAPAPAQTPVPAAAAPSTSPAPTPAAAASAAAATAQAALSPPAATPVPVSSAAATVSGK